MGYSMLRSVLYSVLKTPLLLAALLVCLALIELTSPPGEPTELTSSDAGRLSD